MGKQQHWIVGINAVSSALTHDADNVREILLDAKAGNPRLAEIEGDARRLGIEVRKVTQQALDGVAGRLRHQGVAARYTAAAMNLQALAALKTRCRDIARQPAFEVGVREMLATAPGIAAWGLVTGVAMMKGGIPLPLALLMSWIMYAGSAQLAVLPLIMAGAPLWVIWLTAACVNLRFVILSSMWRGYFSGLRLRHRLAIAYFSGDIIFVAFMKRYPEGQPSPEQVPYFWGAALTNWLAWHLPGTFGMLLASHVPLSWGLGFAGVLALMGVLLSMLQERCAWIACAVVRVPDWGFARSFHP